MGEAQSRVRNQDWRGTYPGTYTNWLGADLSRDALMGEYVWCEDTTGGWELVNPFVLQRFTHYSPTLDGTLFNDEGKELAKFTSYAPDYHGLWPGPSPTAYYADPNLADINEAAWKWLAKSNPSTPELGLYQAIGELKDLPSLVKGYGVNLLRSAASGYLSWRWCIKPMLSDLEKLWNFQEYADKRLKELKKLQSGESMRRRVQLIQDRHITAPENVYIHTQGCYITGVVRTVFTRHRWATGHWTMSDDSPLANLSGVDLIRYARRTMLGVNSRGALSAAWELMPWTWMIDWFSNVGEMLDATNNTIGLNASRMALMQSTTSRTFVNAENHSSSWVSLSGTFDWHYERKWRMPILPLVPFPLPRLPIFNRGKLSILAALAVLRR